MAFLHLFKGLPHCQTRGVAPLKLQEFGVKKAGFQALPKPLEICKHNLMGFNGI